MEDILRIIKENIPVCKCGKPMELEEIEGVHDCAICLCWECGGCGETRQDPAISKCGNPYIGIKHWGGHWILDVINGLANITKEAK